jgi:hypothetical protein
VRCHGAAIAARAPFSKRRHSRMAAMRHKNPFAIRSNTR